jgi:TonB family protein
MRFAVLAGFLVSLSVLGSAQAPQETFPFTTRTFQLDALPDDAPGVGKPVPLQSPRPQYTPGAMRARVQGSVGVQVVVGTDGSVNRARVVQSTWTGDSDSTASFTQGTSALTENAVTTAKMWKFTPGTLNGAPVPVMTTITLTFDIH